MSKPNKGRKWLHGTTIISISIGDGSGIFFKKKGPINQALGPSLDFMREGLQITIPRGKRERRKD